MTPDYDIRRIEVIDDATAHAMRRIGGARRLRMMSEMSQQGRTLMATRVRDQHPEWSQQQIQAEVARRLSDAGS